MAKAKDADEIAGLGLSPDRGPDREPMRAPLRPQARPSDAEIMRMFQDEDTDIFFVDPDITPEDQAWEWKALEVFGKEVPGRVGELNRVKWKPVQYQDYPGYFGPVGQTGNVTRMGQGLYWMDKTIHGYRQRFQQLKAKQAVLDQEASIGIAPPGTFERNHPKLRVGVEKAYEAGPQDVE